MKKWLKLAESNSSEPASARAASQRRIPAWLKFAAPPGDETLDGVGEEELVAPAEALEEVRQRGRRGLGQSNRARGGIAGWAGRQGIPPLPTNGLVSHALAWRPQRGDLGFVYRKSPRVPSLVTTAPDAFVSG